MTGASSVSWASLPQFDRDLDALIEGDILVSDTFDQVGCLAESLLALTMASLTSCGHVGKTSDNRAMAKKKSTQDLRGQLMLQIAAGRFFRCGVLLKETEHRYTVYSNACLIGDSPITLPIGEVIPSTELGLISSAMISVVDRLEQQRPDGTGG